MKYTGKQESASGQITVGYGVSGSASYSKTKMKADSASVNKQAGIFAGDEGYDVDIAGHTELVGGLVTSTDKAEAEGQNRFVTGTIASQDLENHADYKGSAVSASGSMAANFDTPFSEKGIAQSTKTKKDKAGNDVLTHGAESLQTGLVVGLGLDKDSQRSQTKSGINTANLIIRNEQAQLAKTGKTAEETKAGLNTAITTDNAAAHSGKLENRFDKAKLQKELDYQVKVTQEFDKNRQYLKDELHKLADKKREEATNIRKNTVINGKNGYNTEQSLELEKKADKIENIAFYADLALGGAYGWGNWKALSYAGSEVVTTPVVKAATAPEQIWAVKCKGDDLHCADRNADGTLRPREFGQAQIGDKRQIFNINDITPSENTGVITLSNNGILNPLDDALKNAIKQNSAYTKQDGIVVVYNRPTGNPVSELLYAAYDKTNDLIGGYLPLTNAEEANVKLYEYAQSNGYQLDISSHSRGGLTASVAQQYANRKGLKNIPIRESRFFGTATNVKAYSTRLAEQNGGYLYKEKDGRLVEGESTVKSAVHIADFVGNKWNLGLTGFNDTTGGGCIFCYSHSSYFAEVPSEYLKNERNQFIDLKGDVVSKENQVKNPEFKEFNDLWKPTDDNINPSLPKPAKPKTKESL